MAEESRLKRLGKWANNNRVISGAIAGGTVGAVGGPLLPVTVGGGALIGAAIGWLSTDEKKKELEKEKTTAEIQTLLSPPKSRH